MLLEQSTLFRHLYFSSNEIGRERIERVDLDGKNRTTFVDSDINGVKGLVILEQRNELCWAQNGNASSLVRQLSCIGLDQRNRTVVFEYSSQDHIRDLSLQNDERFYWTVAG
jgi:hypothetical protein